MRKFLEKASVNYQLRLRPIREVENSFRAYETSFETERLESERDRKIYCELIDFGRGKKLEKGKESENVEVDKQQAVDKRDSVNEGKVVATDSVKNWWTEFPAEADRTKTLVEIVIKQIADDYRKGKVTELIQGQDAIDFGLVADIELPVLDILELENETFWRRCATTKIKDTVKLQKLLRNPATNWKKVSIELKLIEWIEKLKQTDCDSPTERLVIDDFVEQLQSFVEDIDIKKVKRRTFIEKNPLQPDTRIVNFKNDECFHGSLEFLGGFSNTKNLSVIFGPGILNLTYEKSFFQVATRDIENLGKALEKLVKLESFKTQCDLSEPKKIQFLLSSISHLKNLKVLDLAACEISSKESGEEFEKFLSKIKSLEVLELKENKLDFDFCEAFARGIDKFKGKLKFLGLSSSPILGHGMHFILKSIAEKDNVRGLDVSSCDRWRNENPDGCFREIVELVKRRIDMTFLKINFNYIESEEIRRNLMKALKTNFFLADFDCEDCGFNDDEMFKIRVTVLRNKYYAANPVMLKTQFSREDGIEIDNFLRSPKNHLVSKHKKHFVPAEIFSSEYLELF